MPFISHAQNFEDVILWRALKHVKNGFYVDIGAAWPETHSVTKAFYDRGWCGINIEPNPELYSRLFEQRTRDINVQIAISNRYGEGNLNLFADTGLSTLDTKVARDHIKNLFNAVPFKITTETLASSLHKFLPENQEIHFLKIDVEGFETEVLVSNDWLVYRPWIVIVESTLPLSQIESHHSWEPILLAADYTFVYADGLNRFYLENSHLDLLEFFKFPPNVFDEFVLASQVTAEESQRLAEVRAIAAEESQRLTEARAIAAEESQRLTEARAIAAEESQRLTEARVATLVEELSAIISSRSWRITKPLQKTALQLRQLRFFAQSSLMRIINVQPRVLIAHMLRGLNKLIDRNPSIRKIFLIFLNRFPRIKLYISRALGVGINNAKNMEPDTNDALRLQRIEKIVSGLLAELKDKT